MSIVREKDNELNVRGYKFLGWENSFYQNPPEEKKNCTHLPKGHICDNRGDHTYWCDECRFYYKVDSGD